MRQNILLLVCIAGVISKEDWTGRQKDVKDMSDADLHKLLEEWDKDEEPIPPDELPDGHPDKPRPPLDISKIKNPSDPSISAKATDINTSSFVFNAGFSWYF